MEQQVLGWIAQYGYLAIFSLLVLGIVGLPVPDETLLTFSGYLVYQGHLSLPLAFLSGFAGSACGITLSYILGRTFGLKLIHRYGRYLRITEDHVEKAHAWFRRAGFPAAGCQPAWRSAGNPAVHVDALCPAIERDPRLMLPGLGGHQRDRRSGHVRRVGDEDVDPAAQAVGQRLI